MIALIALYFERVTGKAQTDANAQMLPANEIRENDTPHTVCLNNSPKHAKCCAAFNTTCGQTRFITFAMSLKSPFGHRLLLCEMICRTQHAQIAITQLKRLSSGGGMLAALYRPRSSLLVGMRAIDQDKQVAIHKPCTR